MQQHKIYPSPQRIVSSFSPINNRSACNSFSFTPQTKEDYRPIQKFTYITQQYQTLQVTPFNINKNHTSSQLLTNDTNTSENEQLRQEILKLKTQLRQECREVVELRGKLDRSASVILKQDREIDELKQRIQEGPKSKNNQQQQNFQTSFMNEYDKQSQFVKQLLQQNMMLQSQSQEATLELVGTQRQLRVKNEELNSMKKQIYSHSKINDSLYTISMVVDKHMKQIGLQGIKKSESLSLVKQMKIFMESLQQHAEALEQQRSDQSSKMNKILSDQEKDQYDYSFDMDQ